MNNMNTKRNKKIHYSVFKTMDMGVLTTQTMAAADKDVEWLKVHNTHTQHTIAVAFILIWLSVDDWLILRLFLIRFIHLMITIFLYVRLINAHKHTQIYNKIYNKLVSVAKCVLNQSISARFVCFLFST